MQICVYVFRKQTQGQAICGDTASEIPSIISLEPAVSTEIHALSQLCVVLIYESKAFMLT